MYSMVSHSHLPLLLILDRRLLTKVVISDSLEKSLILYIKYICIILHWLFVGVLFTVYCNTTSIILSFWNVNLMFFAVYKLKY